MLVMELGKLFQNMTKASFKMDKKVVNSATFIYIECSFMHSIDVMWY